MGTFIIRSEREMRLQKVKSHCQKLGSHIGDILNVCQKNPQIRKTRTSTVLGFYYNPYSTSGINKHWGTELEVNL
jgi:hypothetical protein